MVVPYASRASACVFVMLSISARILFDPSARAHRQLREPEAPRPGCSGTPPEHSLSRVILHSHLQDTSDNFHTKRQDHRKRSR
ncbi:uncharacterized protein BJ212DRAFT_28472 [Suillus subaureus]|uniref:Uncharacterized protein n=1 Tax=Suillus subaureus TaxID=48587 RepID=A0A9P7EPS9_9AGAM|nr:uncharacterized protein BJ212DRAFT_28472 [Suillus subaureus]KAG1827065.1 hypothetical protein BJ212DRAFT_28472 [Suillus subaureus]